MSYEREIIDGTLIAVNAMGGVLTVELEDGHRVSVRLLDTRYWSTDAGGRAYRAALAMRGKVGRSVHIDAERHPAYGLAAFGSRAVKFVPRSLQSRRR